MREWLYYSLIVQLVDSKMKQKIYEIRVFGNNWNYMQGVGHTPSLKTILQVLMDDEINCIYFAGQQMTSNCKRAPITCQLISQFPAAHGCRRGQAKFSVMQPDTHVWPHCGPTNCRLRAHLGLVVPSGTALRVGLEKR